jgi:flagellar hook-associated protein 2
MPGLMLGGLASGIDTQAVIDQLMQIERQPQVRLRLRETSLQARQTALGDVATRLRNLASAAKELGSGAAWADTQAVDVSDPSKVAARGLSGAAPGGHVLAVTTLARSEQRSYTYTPAAATLTFTTAAGTTDVSLTAADDGRSAADRINATPGAPVYAVWVKDPGGDTTKDRLVLTRKDTGAYAASDLTVTGPAWAAAGVFTAGVDAAYTVDGGAAQTSRSNVLTAAIPGLELTLKAAGTTSVTVGAPGPDVEAVKTKVRAFVDQYNSTVDFVRGRLAEKRVPGAATPEDARKGALFADTQLNGLLSQLRAIVSDKAPGLTGTVRSMGDLGITTGAAAAEKSTPGALAGTLVLDDAKLADALQNRRLDVKAFLADTAKGVSARLTKLLDPVAKADGLMDRRADETSAQIKRIDLQLARMDDRLTAKSDRLKAQFAAMEAAMAKSQSQSQWLSAQLAGLG